LQLHFEKRDSGCTFGIKEKTTMPIPKILIAAILITSLSACTKDFHSSNWGDSMEEVKLAEGEQQWGQSLSPDGTQTAIYYEGRFEQLPAIIFYAFSDNKLIWGKYVFTELHTRADQYYSDYTIVNGVLQQKHGKANVDYVFSADTQKQTPEQWGESIYEGELMIQTEWQNKRSEVLHAILGENHQVLHSVEYTSIQPNQ
jgi:hypothetical protein